MPHESRRCEHGIDTLRDCPDCENGFALALDEEVKRLRDEAKSLRSQLTTANATIAEREQEASIRKEANGILRAETARMGRELEEARAERDTWKANHDNQVKLRRELMDRPDLGDRAKSLQELHARIERLRAALDISPDDCGRIMHESWTRTKLTQGFHRRPPASTGETCDKCHDDLIPWDELPEKQKDINRHAFDDVLAEIRKRACDTHNDLNTGGASDALRSVKAPPGELERAIQQNDRNWAEAVVRTVVKPEDISRITTFVLDNRPAEIAAVFAALRAQADAPTKEGAD